MSVDPVMGQLTTPALSNAQELILDPEVGKETVIRPYP